MEMKRDEETTYRGGIETKLDLILKQTTEHNHRMDKIELAQAVMRARVTTALAIITFVVGSVLIPLAAAYLHTL